MSGSMGFWQLNLEILQLQQHPKGNGLSWMALWMQYGFKI
jgi:hypothetical protein